MILTILILLFSLWTLFGFGVWFGTGMRLQTGDENQPLAPFPFWISLLCGPIAAFMHLVFLATDKLTKYINK